jgi:hypothetical protein
MRFDGLPFGSIFLRDAKPVKFTPVEVFLKKRLFGSSKSRRAIGDDGAPENL